MTRNHGGYGVRTQRTLRQDDKWANYQDAPIPRPASPFASVSSAKATSLPPGLTLPNSYIIGHSRRYRYDQLEEMRLAASKEQRQLSQGLPSLHGPRTTFDFVFLASDPFHTGVSPPSRSTRVSSRLAASSRSLTRVRSSQPTVALYCPNLARVSPTLSPALLATPPHGGCSRAA
ncbi:hypothetical protein V8E53_015848 [Lactarius tabidus]